MLLSYHNNNDFDLIYDKSFNLESSNLIQNIKDLKIENKISRLNIKYQGNLFDNNYVKTNLKGSENLYNEISDCLKSKPKYETDINIEKKNHPKWHENQILSLFNLKYPKRMNGNNKNEIEKGRVFRKQ